MDSKLNHFISRDSPAIFVVPTYRPQEVGETVARYSENFRSFGYSVPIVVFDDGTKRHVFMGQKVFRTKPDGKHEFTSFESYDDERAYKYIPVHL